MRKICRRTAYAVSCAFGAQRAWPDRWLDPVAVRALSHSEVLQRPDKMDGVRIFDFRQSDR
jgi:hypothetical protein